MLFTEQMTQALAMPAAALAPANYAANTNTVPTNSLQIGAIDMSLFRRALGVVNIGVVVGASCTVTCQWAAGNTSNTTAGAAGWALVPNSAINTSTNNSVLTNEIRADQLPAGKRYLLFMINCQCASFIGAEVWASAAEYKPASANNVNTTLLNQLVN